MTFGRPAPKRATRCGDCGVEVKGDMYFTEVNPIGGYGRDQVLVCDDCMRSGRWNNWKAIHWPNWPLVPRAPAKRKGRG